ncbi:MAG: GxxExxY protein [Chloroflexota bacterium]|nr:GxxExxY protein [Chloroflexota bacterium]
MSELILKQECYRIVGAAMEVYNTLGPGFLEAVYQEAFEIELIARDIRFVPQQELHILYKGQTLGKTYIADFLMFDQVIVEIKALNQLTTHEEAQLLNYLKATGLSLGILINFGHAKTLEWKRMAWTKKRSTNDSIIRED